MSVGAGVAGEDVTGTGVALLEGTLVLSGEKFRGIVVVVNVGLIVIALVRDAVGLTVNVILGRFVGDFVDETEGNDESTTMGAMLSFGGEHSMSTVGAVVAVLVGVIVGVLFGLSGQYRW